MTVFPVNRLSRCDLRRIGNNVLPVVMADRGGDLDAINRSLAAHGEDVDGLAIPACRAAGDSL